jgi:nucleotide-binding universal stress UspA family protein
MAIRDVLLALTSYPDPTPDTAVTAGVAIAATLDARITAIACEARVKLPSTILGNALIDLPALAADEARKSTANVKQLLALVQTEAQKRGVNAETVSEKCFTVDIPERLAEYARFRDLTIVPIPHGDDFDQWYAETVIFGSGRPALVIPHEWSRRERFQLDTVVVAWDFSKTAARAVADAIPVLQKAKMVHVLTVRNEKEIDTQHSAVELARHLAHHRIEVNVDTADAAGRNIGEVLKSYCASRNADLLVMGAYGHSRLREFVLGGATRSMLSHPTIPVLMSH